jgi:hypothetical protein
LPHILNQAEKAFQGRTLFVQLGLNEAETFKPTSALIYSIAKQTIHRQEKMLDADIIKR